ncbi:hypothetical protein ACJRO7_030483 [Eucalyptus globulus]|uniref:Uncharacterized protein n=1 Tax=Eucalyptus globulus TaxID=34317 RepID=A0ABD3JE18_EUCGL
MAIGELHATPQASRAGESKREYPIHRERSWTVSSPDHWRKQVAEGVTAQVADWRRNLAAALPCNRTPGVPPSAATNFLPWWACQTVYKPPPGPRRAAAPILPRTARVAPRVD